MMPQVLPAVLGLAAEPDSGSLLADAALSIALALAVGMIAQSLAHHLRIPGIVLLLAAGVLLGPDLLGVIRP